MAFHNIPPNGFPDIPDIEDLEAVEKDVTNLKSSLLEMAEDITDLSGDITDLGTTKANQITIAPTFSEETSYDIGDLVYYNGLSYKCTTAHEGAWDAEDFTATTIAQELANAGGGGGVDYSTTEQDTGIKWIDGKNIYQKTYEVTGTYTLGNDAWTTIITDASIDTLINVMSINSDGTVSDGRMRWHFDTAAVQAAAIALLNLTDPTVTIYYTKVTT